MQFHVVNAANRHLYGAVLNRFFEVRHDIYVDEKRWREADPRGQEIDQFDTDDATYIVGIDDGKVVSGSRLMPTTVPHMLSEVFPHLADIKGVARQPDVAEWTRGFVAKSHRSQDLRYTAQVCGAVMDYCVREGITAVGGVQDAYWLPLWRRLGWSIDVRGRFHQIDGRRCLAAFAEVSEYARDKAYLHSRLVRSILVHEGPKQAFVARTAGGACAA